MQKLLVSVRGPNEALEAARGGSTITDVEYPASALGTPYPLNITAVREALDRNGFGDVIVSTNIGERQSDRAAACQAALGVATAGAAIVKCGLAELPLKAAIYQGESICRTIKRFHPNTKVVPAVFIDKDLRRFFEPFSEGPELVSEIDADGILIDTFSKLPGLGLLDFCEFDEISVLVAECHALKKEAWIAGSIVLEELPRLWSTGVDVICVRGAACDQKGRGRFGEVKKKLVQELVATIPD